MKFPFSSAGEENKFIVLDIGNASVGGAIVEVFGSEFRFIKSERVDVPYGESINSFGRLAKNTILALGSVLEKLEDKNGHNRHVYVYLSSPWYSSETKIINISRQSPFTFTKTIADEEVIKEIALFKDSLSARKKPGYEDNLSVIESQIISIKLNGYDTAEPFNSKAKEVELSLYLSLGHEKVVKAIDEVIKNFFPNSRVSFHSFPMAFFSTVRDLYPQKKDFLLLDISGEFTDVSLVRNKVILETKSFPMGRNFLIRNIAYMLGCTLPEAVSLTAISAQNALHIRNKEVLQKATKLAEEKWLASFEKILTELSGELYVPDELFLAADDDYLVLFAGWVSNEHFSQYSLSRGKFIVIPVSHARVFAGTDGTRQKADQFLSIGALFAQKLIEVRG